ncbi:MAG: hypothetical protein CFE28_10950 [Alphaproteobacteria bacterium PA2]|nr:MAG: hypothetical protein CFE28_10950 [Alphaproteobacteria bacterium PA2]
MVELDHIPIWTDRSDRILAFLNERLGMGILNGFSPGGQVIARGVRFRNGPFLDIHQLGRVLPGFDRAFHRLVGLAGSIDHLERLGDQHGWKSKTSRRSDAERPDLAPHWSTLSFRRDQGLISDIFVIEYDLETPGGPDLAGPLYDLAAPGAGEVVLDRLWLPVDDAAEARSTLEALGASPLGARASSSPPGEGEAFRLGSVEIVTSAPWGPDRSLRLDLSHPGGLTMEASPVPGLTFVVNGLD